MANEEFIAPASDVQQEGFVAPEGEGFVAPEADVVQETPPEEPKEEIGSWESIKNSMENVVTSIKGTFPRLGIASAGIYEGVLGEKGAEEFYDFFGYDLDARKKEARDALEKVESERLETKGIVGSIKKGDIAGTAAGVVDATTAVASTALPAFLSGSATLFTDMIGTSINDFNQAKADNQGITVDELHERNEQEFTTPATIGVVGGMLEKVGLKGVQKAITKKMQGPFIKKAALMINEFNKEGMTEFIQLGLETYNTEIGGGADQLDAVDKAVDKMFSEEGLEVYVSGVAGAGGASTVGRVVRAPFTKEKIEQLQQIDPKNEEIIDAQIQSDINDGKITVEQAPAEKEKLIADIEAAKSMAGGQIPEGKEVEVHELLKQKNKIKEQQENADEIISETLEEDLQKVDNKLRDILGIKKEEVVEPKEKAEEEVVEKEPAPQEEKKADVTEAGDYQYRTDPKTNKEQRRLKENADDATAWEDTGRETPEILRDKPAKSQKFIQDVMDMGEKSPESIMGIGIGKEEVVRAIKNIKEGKETQSTENFLNKMDEFVEQGFAEITTGSGVDVTKHQVPLDDYSGAVIGEPITQETEVKPEVPVTEEVPKEPETKKKSLLNRAYEGTEDIPTPEDLKKSIEKHGLEFETENWEQAKTKSKDFIKEVGIDNALEAVRQNKIDDGAQAFVWADIIDDIGNRKALAETKEEQAEWEAKEAELLEEFDSKVRSGGRFISALQDVYKNSEFNYNAERRIKEYRSLNKGVIPAEVEAKFREADKQLKEIKKKLAEAEKRAEEAEGDALISNIREASQRGKKKGKKESPKRKGKDLIAEGAQDLAQALGIVKMATGEKKPDVAEALAKIGQGLIDEGLATADNVMQKVKEYVDKNIKGKVDFDKHKKQAAKNIQDWAEDVTPGEVQIPRSLVRDFVERGIDNLNDLTKLVQKAIKDDFPDATERQVRDAISGYGRVANVTKDEITDEINRMKRVGRLVSGLEDVLKKKMPIKSERKRAKLDEKESELRKKLQELTKDLQIETGEFDAKRLAEAKKRAAKRTSELREKIKEKDFDTKKPRPLLADDELTRIKAEKDKWQEVFDKEKFILGIKNRSKLEKLGDIGLELTSSLWRSAAASIDLSVMLVQLALTTVRHPKYAAKSAQEMFKHLSSEEYHERNTNIVRAQGWYPELKASKLDLTESGGKYSAREEMFVSDYVNVIWDSPFNLINRIKGEKSKFAENMKKINPYKAANRAFVGGANTMRMLLYLEGSKHLKQTGTTFESDPESYKAWADYVNNITSRGKLGPLEASAKAVGFAFFSPRKISSGINLLTPYSLIYFGKMPKEVRKMAIKDYASSLGIMVLIAITWQAAMVGLDDEEDWGEFWNPNSSDFLKPRIGSTRIDLFRGLQQNVVTMSRIITGQFVSSTGKVEKLGERFGKDINTRWDVIGKYFSNKFTPSVSFAKKALNQKKGLEVEWVDESLKQALPIWMRDVRELYEEHPIPIAMMLNILAIFGGGVNTYGDPLENKIERLRKKHPDWKESKIYRKAQKAIEEEEEKIEESKNSE